ncbi:MBL fold metallo-hydrolase [Clostridium estertheticum]|uniref:MBL fold metallo-hydrolase n=1 Tax=Clostridium estertheticum TaxID=238834 RepID=UPI001C0DC46B|nr:MBL fold metallo-hydrolase [Clostridium estertheticum]MBU3171746.1 MBL fold metallo-hydrolase [Clostridium estertheticum]
MKFIPIKLSVTTCYLVKYADSYILIDTGYEYDWKLFCTKIEDANVSLSEISHIILTHHHDDHCGLLHTILKENPSIQIVMSNLCKDLLLIGENDHTHGGGHVNKRIHELIRFKQIYISMILKKKIAKNTNLKFPPYKFRDQDIIVNGVTRLREIGIPLDGKIIETPGHTVDSISILFDDGDCIVGDAAANMLRFAGTKYCVIFICDIDEYYKSWEKIISEDAKQIFPAHGKPFSIDKLKENRGKNKVENIVDK